MCITINFIVSFINLLEYILGIKFSINPSLGQAVVTSMTGMLDKLKEFLNAGIASVNFRIKSSDVFQVPVFQRIDGVTLRLGYMVVKEEEEEMIFTIQKIMVKNDLNEVNLTLVPIQLRIDKSVILEKDEIVCGVDNVKVVKGTNFVEEVARNGLEAVARTITRYPLQVQKFIRKHQLSVMMRREVQKFLGGFSMSGYCSLGCIDWRLDPSILGLEKRTSFSLEYRVEKYVEQTSQLDLLMGKKWDVRTLNGTDGYRIILTLQLAVDLNHELLMKMHATIATGKLEKKSYRDICLKDITDPHISSNRRMSDITQHGTSGATNHGLTLAWDEFPTRIHSAETSLCPVASAPSTDIDESMDDIVPGNLPGMPSSTSTAFNSLERMLAAIPQSQLVFNSPIKEVSGEYTFMSTTASSGPNTSTPAEILNLAVDVLRDGDRANNTHHTPQSSPSLPGLKKVDAFQENISKCCKAEMANNDVGSGSQIEENGSVAAETKAQVKFCRIPLVKALLRSGLIYQDKSTSEEGHNILELEDQSLAKVKNIIEDLELDPNNSMNGKTFEKSVKLAETKDLVEETQNNNNPITPFKLSTQNFINQYLQTLPTSATQTCKCEENSVSRNEEDCSPRSQSTPSPFSDLSSRARSRLVRGLFSGSPPALGVQDPVCPFPEDWKYSFIPDAMDDKDEID